jgi:hypothetical protein
VIEARDGDEQQHLARPRRHPRERSLER